MVGERERRIAAKLDNNSFFTVGIGCAHRRAFNIPIKIDSALIPGRVAGEPAAKDWGAATVAGYRCSVFGIAVVDATVRTNLVIATAPFTGAFGQQDFIDRDHNTASKWNRCHNHNAPWRGGKAAAVRACRKTGGTSACRSGMVNFLPRWFIDPPLKIQSTDQNLHAPKNPCQMHFGGCLRGFTRLMDIHLGYCLAVKLVGN
jgi:hypothetical protein